MSLEDNKTIARRYVEECFIQGNMDVFDTSFAPHLTFHNYGFPTRNHANVRAQLQQVHQAFSDGSVIMHDLIAEGDTVALHFSYKASAHHSHFGKNHPTGQPVQSDVMFFFHFEQGKVVEVWALYQGVQQFDFSPA